ncbi:quinone-dependent dihydroorotate dehydrogenase [Aurantimicrobium sp. MWH-Uga1]|uniref:quinone-dependent dihydroorotate dehydrogenase n=1 Tax=Aurantimicrobium sp. MWH-Uga1 TaxID=2079575 RepID=UPI000DEE0C10|nr:quinone-dependent dihydroorotate dehydrogenase [Aurantimicrobium sp. MWH-Uga1]AXE54495.1 Dihydroorotate dehydrogenase (quinone) [Aurantimicrobium sp. MWH-Uga1]
MTTHNGSHSFYNFIFHSFFKHLDAEKAHHLGAFVIRLIGLPGIRHVKHGFTRPAPELHVQALGLNFDSPFGMAAGFDKDVTMVSGLYALGFGHVEVGTLTAHAQPGNPKPRLFRLIPDRALVNRMGFNNRGAAAAVSRLIKLRKLKHRPVIGVNIGKSRIVDVENAIDDYLTSTRLLAPLADYLVVNVSSPNTPGLRGLQELSSLSPLLTAVKDAAADTPLLVKIAPDLSTQEIRAIAQLATKLKLDGIIATNTTISRSELKTAQEIVDAIGAGGLSGAPLHHRSLEVLKELRNVVPAEMCLISVGGIETAQQIQERLDAGATLVQGYTGFIYNGPAWALSINRGLRKIRKEEL